MPSLAGFNSELQEIFKRRLFLWVVATTNENGMMLGGEFIKEKAMLLTKSLSILHNFLTFIGLCQSPRA